MKSNSDEVNISNIQFCAYLLRYLNNFLLLYVWHAVILSRQAKQSVCAVLVSTLSSCLRKLYSLKTSSSIVGLIVPGCSQKRFLVHTDIHVKIDLCDFIYYYILYYLCCCVICYVISVLVVR